MIKRLSILVPSVSRTERHQRHLDEVSELIKAARRRADLTQVELAARMTAAGEPTTRSQVSMWELGAPSGRLPSTAKLLTILEVTRASDAKRHAADRWMLQLDSDLAVLRGRGDG